MTLPGFITDAGDDAAGATIETFLAQIPNANTREAYGRAVRRFGDRCDANSVALRALTAPVVALYLEDLSASLSVRA